MGRKDSLSKEIDGISREIRFYQNMFLALMSAIFGIIFGIVTNKLEPDILYVAVGGAVVIAGITVRIKFLHKKEQKLILELEKE